MLSLQRMTLRFKIAVFPRSILFRPLPCVLPDEDRGQRIAIAVFGFCQPNRLAAPITNAVVRHKPPRKQIRSI